jgi:hypothetical protein
MPQLFKIGPYIVYFWSNEGFPQEPVHVHVKKESHPQMLRNSGLPEVERPFWQIIIHAFGKGIFA